MNYRTILVAMGLLAIALPSASRAQEAAGIPGVTEPIRNVLLKAWGKKSPPFSGRIARVLVKEGQLVEAGQPLLEMDKRDEEIDVRLKELLARDDAELKTVKERERLLKNLWLLNKSVADENRSVSREEVTKRELDYRVAMAERQRMEVADERAKIELEAAQVGLQNRTILSPVRGTIVKIHMREGETCEASDPLMQIVDTSRCVFICNVEEKVGHSLREGQAVTLRIQSGGGSEARAGVLTFVSPVVESASFLLQVKAEFSNEDGKIRPGSPGVMVLGAQ